jgi:hypothetical protein
MQHGPTAKSRRIPAVSDRLECGGVPPISKKAGVTGSDEG